MRHPRAIAVSVERSGTVEEVAALSHHIVAEIVARCSDRIAVARHAVSVLTDRAYAEYVHWQAVKIQKHQRGRAVRNQKVRASTPGARHATPGYPRNGARCSVLQRAGLAAC